MNPSTPFEFADTIATLRARQWHLDTIGSYSAADDLQAEIDRLLKLVQSKDGGQTCQPST